MPLLYSHNRGSFQSVYDNLRTVLLECALQSAPSTVVNRLSRAMSAGIAAPTNWIRPRAACGRPFRCAADRRAADYPITTEPRSLPVALLSGSRGSSPCYLMGLYLIDMTVIQANGPRCSGASRLCALKSTVCRHKKPRERCNLCAGRAL